MMMKMIHERWAFSVVVLRSNTNWFPVLVFTPFESVLFHHLLFLFALLWLFYGISGRTKNNQTVCLSTSPLFSLFLPFLTNGHIGSTSTSPENVLIEGNYNLKRTMNSVMETLVTS